MASDMSENSRRGGGDDLGAGIGPDLLARLDSWIAAQPEPRPSRPQAVARLLTEALGGTEAGFIAVEELNASNDE